MASTRILRGMFSRGDRQVVEGANVPESSGAFVPNVFRRMFGNDIREMTTVTKDPKVPSAFRRAFGSDLRERVSEMEPGDGPLRERMAVIRDPNRVSAVSPVAFSENAPVAGVPTQEETRRARNQSFVDGALRDGYSDEVRAPDTSGDRVLRAIFRNDIYNMGRRA